MQLKHSRSFHKLRCWKSHQLEVVGGKKKKKRKNWRKTREVRVKAVTRSPLQSTALEGLRQQKYFKIDLEEYFIKKTIYYFWRNQFQLSTMACIIQNFEHWGMRYTSLSLFLLEVPGCFPKIYMLQV